MEDNTRLPVWDRVAGETGELLSPVSDATSVKARTLSVYSAYSRGPPKDFKEPMLQYDMERHKGIYPSARCILVETLIDDIPTTEYSVYIFNEVNAADKTKLDMSKLPDWTDEDGLQNIFFPHHSTAAQPVNHYHAVVGSGFPYPNLAQNGSTTVNLRIGPGGVEHEWNPDFGIYPKDVFPFQETNRSYLVAYGAATCIKLKFEIGNDKHEPVVFGPEDSVVKGREVNQMYWHDTARVIIGQPNHPFKISLNFRFVKTQHPDPEVPHQTGVQMFSIRRIRAKTEPATSSVKGRLVNTYTYTITLMNR